jgi:hypothetical protein
MSLHTHDTRPLLFIGRLYHHPDEIVRDPDISVKRKRALLSDWASDRNAVPSKPALRRHPVTGVQCSIDEIIAALRSLDSDDPHRPRGVRLRPPPPTDGLNAAERERLMTILGNPELQEAFDIAWSTASELPEITLESVVVRDVIARKISVTASGGETNKIRLANEAVAFLRRYQRMMEVLEPKKERPAA